MVVTRGISHSVVAGTNFVGIMVVGQPGELRTVSVNRGLSL